MRWTNNTYYHSSQIKLQWDISSHFYIFWQYNIHKNIIILLVKVVPSIQNKDSMDLNRRIGKFVIQILFWQLICRMITCHCILHPLTWVKISKLLCTRAMNANLCSCKKYPWIQRNKMMLIFIMILPDESNHLLRSLINYFVVVADEHSRKKQAKTPNLWRQNTRELSLKIIICKICSWKVILAKFVQGKEIKVMTVLL